MQYKPAPTSDFFEEFLQMTLTVLADTDVKDFEPTLIDPNEQTIAQIEGIPADMPHAQAVREKLAQFDLTRGPIFIAFRAYEEPGRLYLGEVGPDGTYFAAIEIIGRSVYRKECDTPPFWASGTISH